MATIHGIIGRTDIITIGDGTTGMHGTMATTTVVAGAIIGIAAITALIQVATTILVTTHAAWAAIIFIGIIIQDVTMAILATTGTTIIMAIATTLIVATITMATIITTTTTTIITGVIITIITTIIVAITTTNHVKAIIHSLTLIPTQTLKL
jgi:hypothetical protein